MIFVVFGTFPPEPPELVLLDDTLDMDITDCGRFVLRQVLVTGPAIEFLNRGTAEEKITLVMWMNCTEIEINLK